MRAILSEWLRILGRDRASLVLLAALVLLSLAAGLAPAREAAIGYAINLAWWWLLPAVAFFFFLLARALPWRRWAPANWTANAWANAALVLLVAGIIHTQERHEYKTLADEPDQVGISLLMHEQRKAETPIRAHYFGGEFEIVEAAPSKRSGLYPFLVSCVHDLTGYRVENAFVVNGLMTVLCLTLALAIGRDLGGETAGRATLLLLGGLPLFARMACGAGFELTNLTLIFGFLAASTHYLRRPGANSTSLLCMVAVLLAHCRYESILFVPAAAIVLLAGWWREGRFQPGMGLFAAPVFLVLYLWRYRQFEGSAETWQTWSQDVTSPFSLSYVPEQIGRAIGYLVSPHDYFDSSVPLVVAGAIGILAALIHLVWRWRNPRPWHAPELAFAWSLPVFAFLGLMMLSYYWPLDDPLVTRLLLPLFVPMILAVAWMIGKLPLPPVRTGCLIVAAVIFAGYGVPKIVRHQAADRYFQARQMRHIDAFLDSCGGDRDFLVISFLPVTWINEKVAAMSIKSANRRQRQLATLIAHPMGPQVFTYQVVTFAPGEPHGRIYRFRDDSSARLEPNFQTEILFSEYDAPPIGWRMSEVTDIEGARPIDLPARDAEQLRGLWETYVLRR
ncbi:MAG: hypothetical protein ACFB21_02390 [Opitutales bacterium]